MRIATFILVCLLTMASPALVMAEPAEATAGGAPIFTDPDDGDNSGMTCCHHG